MCMDTESSSLSARLMLWSCHGHGQNQFFAFAKSGQIVVLGEFCVGINHLKEVILVRCSDTDKTQLWTYDKEVGSQNVTLFSSCENPNDFQPIYFLGNISATVDCASRYQFMYEKQRKSSNIGSL